MKQHMRMYGTVAALALWGAVSANAVTIEPNYGTFGSQPTYTFGGSGIPNDSVANQVIVSGANTITFGLTAHARYDNPAPGNDGAGTFYAPAGNDAAHGQPGYAQWNFGYYVNFTPDRYEWGTGGYSVQLRFDKNPAVGNDVSTFIPIEPNILNGFGFDSQNSLNLGMTSIFGSGFNPLAYGEYGLQLELYKDGNLLGTDAIKIVVNETGSAPAASVPDGGSTAGLMGAGICCLGLLRRAVFKV